MLLYGGGPRKGELGHPACTLAGKKVIGFLPLYVCCLKCTALGSALLCWWDPYFTCSISDCEPHKSSACSSCWQLRLCTGTMPVLPTTGSGSAVGSGGVKDHGRPGDEGSRKRGDALGSISGSEEEEVWRSRCLSARQDVCPAASPGQDTSLYAFSCPAKGVR